MEGITGMSREWKNVRLGEVLSRTGDTIEADPSREYREITVKLWGKGVIERGRVSGAQVNGRRFVARTGNFIASRIDARNGAMGLVPESLDGALVTNDFPLFEANKDRLDLDYLGWLSKTAGFVELCLRASEGTTNRVRLKEERFLNLEIPLPPLTEQRRIVARIEALAAQIEEARRLRKEAVVEAEAMIRSQVSQIDQSLREKAPLTRVELLAMRERGSMRSGPFGSALLHDEFVASGIPAVGIQDVQENRFVLSRRWNVTPDKAKELARYRIRPNDILITVMGTLGRACVVPPECGEMVSTKHIWTLSLDQSLCLSRWLSYWFNFSRKMREELLGQTTGTAIPGLNGEKIKNAQIPNIPVLEQRRIVAELDALQEQVDTLKHLQSETAAELDALLPAILDRAFKGEL
jgi:type I restriction enzyme S subunit